MSDGVADQNDEQSEYENFVFDQNHAILRSRIGA